MKQLETTLTAVINAGRERYVAIMGHKTVTKAKCNKSQLRLKLNEA